MRLVTKGVVRRRRKAGIAYYARIVWETADGRRHSREKKATTKTAAKAFRDQMAAEFERDGPPASADVAKLTFGQLAEVYIQEKCIPAVFAGERKIAGQRHPHILRNQVRRLIDHFSDRRLAELATDWDAVQAFKLRLIAAPTQRGKVRSMHDVNNLLRILRVVLNFAKRKGWIKSTPFEINEPLINPSDEQPRKREEKPGELEALLEACTGRRAHLRPWIVTAHQTAARPGEVSRIERRDILWDQRVIRLRASTTKTNRERLVPLSAVLHAELASWLEFVASDPQWAAIVPPSETARIFGPAKSNKTAFYSACKAAGIANLQRKDLRKFSTTRLLAALSKANIHYKHAMAITGHTQEKTFESYLITGLEVARQAGEALDAFQKKS